MLPRRLLDAGSGSGCRGSVAGRFGRAIGLRGCRGWFDFDLAMGDSIVSGSIRRTCGAPEWALTNTATAAIMAPVHAHRALEGRGGHFRASTRITADRRCNSVKYPYEQHKERSWRWLVGALSEAATQEVVNDIVANIQKRLGKQFGGT